MPVAIGAHSAKRVSQVTLVCQDAMDETDIVADQEGQALKVPVVPTVSRVKMVNQVSQDLEVSQDILVMTVYLEALVTT